MIDGAGRGQIAGGETAGLVCALSAEGEFTDAWIEGLALDVLARMKGEGCAHLYPEEKFIREFIRGFKQAILLRER